MPVLLALALAAPALAHDTYAGENTIHGVRFDIHGDIDGYGMFGVGARVEFAIVPDGFLRSTKVYDELALSFGADVLFSGAPLWIGSDYDGGSYIVPVGAVQWNVYLGHHWSVFPEVGVALHVGFAGDGWNDRYGRSYGWLYAQPHVGVGARLHLNPRVALLFRVSTPTGLQFGVVF